MHLSLQEEEEAAAAAAAVGVVVVVVVVDFAYRQLQYVVRELIGPVEMT